MSDPDFDQSSSPRPRLRRASPFFRFRALIQPRSWAAAFTREKIIDAIKTLAWVAPLTILIWVYAEREQIITPTFPAVVHLKGSNLSINPAQAHVSLDLKGPQSGVERVRDQLSSQTQGITIDLGNSIGQGQQHVNILDRIQNLPLFRDTGVSVTKADPAEIDVTVDNTTQISVPVQSPPDAQNLEPSTHYEPATVIVRGPASRLNGKDKVNVYANLEGVDLTKPGHRELTVDLSLADKDPTLSIEPTAAKAFLDVRSPNTTKTLDSVVIWVAGPQIVLDNYEITNLPTSLSTVKVTGPPKALELLVKTPPHAIVTITGDDYPNEQPKQLEYVLPPDVKVSPEDQARTVTFKLVKRPTS